MVGFSPQKKEKNITNETCSVSPKEKEIEKEIFTRVRDNISHLFQDTFPLSGH